MIKDIVKVVVLLDSNHSCQNSRVISSLQRLFGHTIIISSSNMYIFILLLTLFSPETLMLQLYIISHIRKHNKMINKR